MKPTTNTSETDYHRLANLVGVPWLHNELKKALTHKSFYTEKEEDKSQAKMSARKRRHIQDKKK